MTSETSDAELSAWTGPYVESLKAAGWIRTGAVEEAFRRVPRHRLIEHFYSGTYGLPLETAIDPANLEHLRMVYSDRSVIMHMPDKSVSSMPSLMALILESLELEPGLRVLEIGAGSGYNAAILSELVTARGAVTTTEITTDLVDGTRRRLAAAGYSRVQVEARDGFLGCPERAPYDRIVMSTACGVLSPHLVSQLATHGLMLVPLLHGGVETSPMVRVTHEDGRIEGRVVVYSQFMPPRGDLALELWGFDRKALWARKQMENGPPRREEPLWDGLRDVPNPTPRPSPKWAARLELLYYLALRSRQTFLLPEGLGLGDSTGFVIVGDDSVRSYGDGADAHHALLQRAYREWVDLGRPCMTDWRSTFVPRADVEATPVDAAGDRTWTLDRGHYLQVLRLPR
ncbi:MAG: hypothetical protein IT379_18290 [Deltaproteobacteria bacterium]|nr:hypothetical protein [Deltaproteobacteria bacterium]